MNKIFSEIFLILLFLTASSIAGDNRRSISGTKDNTGALSEDFSRTEPSAIRIKAVGDIMMGTTYPKEILPPDEGKNLFSGIRDYLGDCDILLGNLEGTFVSTAALNKEADGEHVFAFSMPVHYADLLKEAGFDIVNIANNHAYDFGEYGFKSSISKLEEAGINFTGLKRKLTILKKKNIKIGFAGFYWKPFFNDLTDLDETRKFLESVRKDVDILVVTFHGGAEGIDALHIKDEIEYYGSEERGNGIAFAHTAIQSGADIVIGHGPHVPRALEFYMGKLIAYSLGNFCTYGVFNMKGPRKNSFILEADLSFTGEFLAGKVIPVILKGRGIPYYDSEGGIISILQDITKIDFPSSGAVISGSGIISKKVLKE